MTTSAVTFDRNVGGGATMATITGRVGIEEANELHRRFEELFKAGRPWVIIRMNDVDFICSAGMGTLLSAVGESRKRGGEIIFADVSPKVRTIFEFLDIWDYITTAADKDAALAMVTAGKRKRDQRAEAGLAPSFIIDDLRAKLKEGIRLSKEGKIKDALAYFNAVIRADRDNTTALVWKGNVLERLGQYGEARRLYKRVTEIGRGDPQLLSYARGRLEKLGQRLRVATDREKAFEQLRAAVRTLAEAPARAPVIFTPERSVETAKAPFLECFRTWDDGTYYGDRRSRRSFVWGGGYFVWIGGRGFVVDPGKNFVVRFAEAGRRLADIDAIVVTDAAWDYGADLEPLLEAFNRYRKAEIGPARKVEVLINGAAYKKNYPWLATLADTVLRLTVLSPGNAYRVGDATLNVKLGDATKSRTGDALGLMFTAGRASFAYVGDVVCRDLDALAAQYMAARGYVLLAHVGDVCDSERASSERPTEYRGVEAVGRLFSEVRPSIGLVGKISNVTDPIALSEALAKATDVRCLPVDVGLTVNLETSEILTTGGLTPPTALTIYQGEDGRLHYNPAA